MTDEFVEKSRSPPGEVLDAPSDGDIVTLRLTDENGNEEGFVLRWKNTLGAYFVADCDSVESLDANL